jgi:multiple sugar transport system substrate-binding protein
MKRRTRTARPLRTGLALLCAAVLVAGCSRDRPAGPAGRAAFDGTGPFTFVTGRDTTGYLRGVLSTWNAAHPDQAARLIELPEAADDQRAQMVTNLQARSDRYDVLNLDVPWTAEFADAGWIVPLDRREFPLDRFLPPAVATAEFEGRLFAVPYTSNGGLLYYRKDILDRERARPPRTWAELERLASTLAPKYGIGGYAGQFLAYEGLTVNFAEAVQSAGGEILADDGRRVTVDSAQAHKGLEFLVRGLRMGWIPQAALTFKEEESRRAFQEGRLLFLRNWPAVWGVAGRPGPGSKVAGRFDVVRLPGLLGSGSSSLGGANLAVSAYSKRKRSALEFIKFLTALDTQRQVLVQGSLPPVWEQLYDDPALIHRFPYLPTLKQSILSARPRPKSPNYNQVSLAISKAVHDALSLRLSPDAALSDLAQDLNAIVRNQ